MSGSIPEEFIRELVALTNIVPLIERYVSLKKKGKDYWGLCPFCDDGNNPSFSVSDQKQFYYCFKCRATGNVIGFVQNFEGLGFVESVEALASREGLEVPYQQKPLASEDKSPVFEVLLSASNFFESVLANDSSAKSVRNYIKKDRYISGNTCRRFSVGYAPKSWTALTSHLTNKGFSKDLIIKAGLAKKNKEQELFDIFRDRLMFPIKDKKGRPVGFGGRVMNPQDQPKYLNTGDTPVFQKGKELYGFYEALKERKNLSRMYVVEGYMDVIAMFENEIFNSVATLGIATNRFHTQKILQFVKEVVFCFDGDDAGRGAAWGALKSVLPVINDGVEISFLFLPDNEDPASLLEKENKETFEARLESSLPLSEYFIERLSKAVGTRSLERKALLASKAMDLLKFMPQSSIKKLLEIEVSKITGLKEEDIKQKVHSLVLDQTKRKRSYMSKHGQDSQEKEFESDRLISKALAALLTFPSLLSELGSTEWLEELPGPESNLLLEVISYFNSNPEGHVADLLSSIDADSASFLGSLLSNTSLIEEKNSVVYFKDCMEAMKKGIPKIRIEELKKLLTKETLSDEETFELQQHLLSNLENLSLEDKQLLRDLSKG